MATKSTTTTKLSFFFESKHMTRLNGFLFCLSVDSGNQCKNGVQLYESKYPMSVSQINQSKYVCHCWTGYWGSQCDAVNPCYTMFQNSTKIANNTEPLPFPTKWCQNEGICLPTKAPALYTLMSGLKYVPYCLCRPQFAGKMCDRNIDGCKLPFIYGNKYYNK